MDNDEFTFVEIERGSFGGLSGLEDNLLRLTDSSIALSQNLRPFFKALRPSSGGHVTVYRAKVSYDPNRVAFRLVEAQPGEGFAFHGKGRTALQGRVPAHLERLNPARGTYRLVKQDDNQLIFRKED